MVIFFGSEKFTESFLQSRVVVTTKIPTVDEIFGYLEGVIKSISTILIKVNCIIVCF